MYTKRSMMHNRFKTNAAFTIVELLIAMVVIGILATIATVGYIGYLKNAKKAQVAATTSAYQDATRSIVSENKLYDAAKVDINDNIPGIAMSCISAVSDTTPCCYLSKVLTGSLNKQYQCITNQLMDDRFDTVGAGPVLQKGTILSASLRNYLKGSLPPTLPRANNSSFACVNTGTLFGSTFMGSMDCFTQEITLTVHRAPTGVSRLFLHYTLPPDMDCPSKNVATVLGGDDGDGAPLVSYMGAPYTDRSTTGANPFTYCMINIQ